MEEVIGKPLNEVVKEDQDNLEEFIECLEEYEVSPFLSWDAQRKRLANDPRYLSLSSNGARLVAFNEWRKNKAASKEAAGGNEDELAKFAAFIHSQYKPGMLYPLFKRRFRNSTEFQRSQLPEKEKEGLFREYVLISKIEDAEDKKAYIESKPAFAKLNGF